MKIVRLIALVLACLDGVNTFGQTQSGQLTQVDTLNGEIIKRNPDGTVMIRSNYSSGELHGEWQFYNKRGKLQLSNHFTHGVMDRYSSYWKSGNQRVLAHFYDDYMDGEMKTFYPDGRPETTVFFRDGKILSALRIYDKKGRLMQIKYPSDQTREYLISVDIYNRKGVRVETKNIRERPSSFYLFGASHHKSGPLETQIE